MLTVLLPAWIAASKRSYAFWRFFWRMTPSDRERRYVGELLGGRDEAKEVRAFDLADFLFERWNRLYDHRLKELRSVARRQLMFTLFSTFVIGLMLGAILLLVAFLASSGRVTLAEAGVAVAGIAIIGARIAGAGYSVSSLSEAGFYLDDFATFLEMAEAPPPSSIAAPASFKTITAEAISFTYPSSKEPALSMSASRSGPAKSWLWWARTDPGSRPWPRSWPASIDPRADVVAWDGLDIATIDRADFSRRVAVIFQDFLRYHLSASDNIGLGRFEGGRRPQMRSSVRPNRRARPR